MDKSLAHTFKESLFAGNDVNLNKDYGNFLLVNNPIVRPLLPVAQ
jgi:hypothetical protein